MPVERTALFVRVPTVLADELAARTQRVGRSKQDVVCDLLQAQLNARDTEAEARNGADADDSPTDDRAGDGPEVLDLVGVSAMLAIEPDAVLERVAAGDFPGRRFGADWRFSRLAVMRWLEGTDPMTSPSPTGFATP